MDDSAGYLLDRVEPILRTLGRQRDEVVDAKVLLGRNLNGEVEFADGGRAFVKQLTGLGADGRLRRSVSFHETVAVPASADFRAPELLASDDGSLTLAYEFIPEGSAFGPAVRERTASDDELERAGRCLGALHSLPIVDPSRADDTLPMLPPFGPNTLTTEIYYGSTMGQLDVWRYIQRDQPLRERLSRMVLDFDRAEGVPVHGDLRADQIFMTVEQCWMLDWE